MDRADVSHKNGMQPSRPPNTHSDRGESKLLFIHFPGNAPVVFLATRSSDVHSQGPNPQLPEWAWTVVATGPEAGAGVGRITVLPCWGPVVFFNFLL